MEWVKPIDEVEAECRRLGVFLLVDMDGHTLRFYTYSRNTDTIDKAMAALKGRGQHMVDFLTRRARAYKG